MDTLHHHIILGLGTNTQQDLHMQTAQATLRQLFPDIRFTRSLRTEPIGPPSPPYLNALATATTALTPEEINTRLKTIEQQMGRTPADKALHRVIIDLDMLQYDQEKFRPTDWQRPYVQLLAQELHADGKPGTSSSHSISLRKEKDE